MQRLRPYAVETALAVLLVAAGVLPWVSLATALPWGADASKWVAWSSFDSPRWLHWAVNQKHFVGYRPVTALSFVLNHATTGYSAIGYASFDIALNVIGGVLVFKLYRALFDDRSAWGLVPVVLLFGHPVLEEVVPFAARRSYLLATVFGLGALLAALRGLEPGRRGWAWALLGGVVLGLAVLSNEVAYVVLPLLPMLALDRAGWRGLARTLPAAAVCAAAVVLRHHVLGVWGGGYRKLFFAFVQNGVPMWRERLTWDPRGIATACWRYLLDPIAVDGDAPLVPGGAGDVVVLVLLAWIVGFAIVRPLFWWRRPHGRAPLVLGAWLVGSTAIVVLSQTWFWRQAHSLLPPLGLLVAHALSTSWSSLRESRWRASPGLAGGALLLACALWNGPLWTGADTEVHAARIQGTRVVRQVGAAMEGLRGPGTVWIVVPVRGSTSHLVRLWVDRLGASRKITARVLGHLAPTARGGGRVSVVDGPDGRPRVHLSQGYRWVDVPPFSAMAANAPFDPSQLYKARKVDTWVIGVDEADVWVLEVEPPPPGLPLLGDTPEPPDDEPALEEVP